MKRFGMLAAVSLSVAAAASAAPRKPVKKGAGAKPKLTAAQVLDKSAQACGGTAAYARVKNVLMDGTVDLLPFGVRGTFEHRVKAPNKSLNISHYPLTGEGRQCFDGKEAWGFSTAQGYRTITGAEKVFLAHNSRLQSVVNWRELYTKLEMLGLRKLGDRSAYAVRAHLAGHAPLTYFFDAKTFLPLRMDTVTSMDTEKNLSISMTFSDYRVVDGIKWPFRSISKVSTGRNAFTSDMRVNNLLTNVAMKDELFVKPESPVAAGK